MFIGDVTTTEIEFTEEDCCGPFHRFTLTCNSTGGPATTVTWTKDSVNITEGTESTYNNITAQYTHTLTLSERVGGFYTCNVSNDKPSFDSSNFTLQGEEILISSVYTLTYKHIVASDPTDLTLVQEGNSIHVSWNPPDPLGDTKGYRVYYTNKMNVTGSVESNTATVTRTLMVGFRYTISVVGISMHLPSEAMNGSIYFGKHFLITYSSSSFDNSMQLSDLEMWVSISLKSHLPTFL